MFLKKWSLIPLLWSTLPLLCTSSKSRLYQQKICLVECKPSPYCCANERLNCRKCLLLPPYIGPEGGKDIHSSITWMYWMFYGRWRGGWIWEMTGGYFGRWRKDDLGRGHEDDLGRWREDAPAIVSKQYIRTCTLLHFTEYVLCTDDLASQVHHQVDKLALHRLEFE